jgi:hypothetical protein
MKKSAEANRDPIPPVLLGLRPRSRYIFRQIDAWLRSLSAKPLSRKTKQRLMAGRNWGMPDE